MQKDFITSVDENFFKLTIIVRKAFFLEVCKENQEGCHKK